VMTSKTGKSPKSSRKNGRGCANFIRRRVPDPSTSRNIVQDVFYELVEANRC